MLNVISREFEKINLVDLAFQKIFLYNHFGKIIINSDLSIYPTLTLINSEIIL